MLIWNKYKYKVKYLENFRNLLLLLKKEGG